jgi:DNA-binding transcriptional ArsR family regulator
VADRFSIRANEGRRLRFACSCASAADVSDDPWAVVSKEGKLNDGTKELILNAIHPRPRTIAQLAQHLGLSRPAVHRHVTEMLSSDLIREVGPPEGEREWAVERYYEPNFPVLLSADRREFLPVMEELSREFAETFKKLQADLSEAFSRTSLPAREERLEGVLHCLYATVARMARVTLEAEGVLPPWPEHADGSRWVWWAEEPLEQEKP